jgi:hypothetical protein
MQGNITLTLEARFPWRTRALFALLDFCRRLEIPVSCPWACRLINRWGLWYRAGSGEWSRLPFRVAFERW